MKNRVLGITRHVIPYVKELRPYAKSITSCILMQQLDYWFTRHPNGFYKFLEPCTDHKEYRVGDSWFEELAISPTEFRTAFDYIGTRYSSKSEFSKAVDKFKGKLYCSYVDKVKRLTYYFRNHEKVDEILDKMTQMQNCIPTDAGGETRCRSESLEMQNCSSRDAILKLPVAETLTGQGFQPPSYTTPDITPNTTSRRRTEEEFLSREEENSMPLPEQQEEGSDTSLSFPAEIKNTGAAAARDNNVLRPRGAVLASRTGQQIVYEAFNPFHKVQTEKRNFHDDTPWSELAKEVGEKREDVHKVLHEWLVVFVTKNKPQINEPEGYSGGVIHNWVKTPGSHETNPLWCDFASQVREDGLAAIRSRLHDEKQQLTRLATEAERQKEIDRQARLKWQEEQAQKAELAKQYWMAQAEKAKKETGGASTSDPLLDILPTRILNIDDTEYDF
jgi:hypothetical protein